MRAMSKKRSRTDAKRDPRTVAFWAFMAVALVVGAGLYWASESRTPPESTAPAYAPAEYKVPEAPTASLVRPVDRPLGVLVAGDSISNGTFADPGLGYRDLLLADLASRGPVVDQRVGKAGEIAADAIDDLATVTGPIDLVVVELGTNDVTKSTPEQFRIDYPVLLDKIHTVAPVAAMVCVGPWNGKEKAGLIMQTIRQECESRGGVYASITDLYEMGPPTTRGPEGQLTADGRVRDIFHPNTYGHSRIAERITSAIKDTAAQR